MGSPVDVAEALQLWLLRLARIYPPSTLRLRRRFGGSALVPCLLPDDGPPALCMFGQTARLRCAVDAAGREPVTVVCEAKVPLRPDHAADRASAMFSLVALSCTIRRELCRELSDDAATAAVTVTIPSQIVTGAVATLRDAVVEASEARGFLLSPPADDAGTNLTWYRRDNVKTDGARDDVVADGSDYRITLVEHSPAAAVGGSSRSAAGGDALGLWLENDDGTQVTKERHEGTCRVLASMRDAHGKSIFQAVLAW